MYDRLPDTTHRTSIFGHSFETLIKTADFQQESDFKYFENAPKVPRPEGIKRSIMKSRLMDISAAFVFRTPNISVFTNPNISKVDALDSCSREHVLTPLGPLR